MTTTRYSENWFTANETTISGLSTGWTKIATGFRCISVTIENQDSNNNTLEFSFDGVNPDGRVSSGSSIYISDKAISTFYIRAKTSTVNTWQVMCW